VKQSEAVPVRITVGHPRLRLGYELGGRLPCLYPDRSLLAIDDPAVFEASYRRQLDTVGVDSIASEFAAISADQDGRGLVLLCFEDVDLLGEQSCHRRIFAHWWEEQTGQVVPELGSGGCAST
jgi:hypothetical protein